MKKNRIITGLLYSLILPVFVIGCDDDDAPGATVGFSNIASTVQEADAGTITIPFSNAGSSASNLSVSFSGEAKEGEDFTLVGVTAEGVQLAIIDDSDVEFDERISVQIKSNGRLVGNNVHHVTVISNCQDKGKPFTQFFRGLYLATEKYGPNPPAANWYGPYEMVLEPHATDPNILVMHNFYDSGREAYLQFDPATGKVWFPEQTPLPDTTPNKLTASTGTFSVDECNHTTLTIQLNYDGGTWEYFFEKQ